jgi:hypothetical protein
VVVSRMSSFCFVKHCLQRGVPLPASSFHNPSRKERDTNQDEDNSTRNPHSESPELLALQRCKARGLRRTA